MKKCNIFLFAGTLAGMTMMMSACGLFNKNSTKMTPVLPQDRENIVERKDKKSFTSDEAKRGVVKGDWAIETVMGKKAVVEKGRNGFTAITDAMSSTPTMSAILLIRHSVSTTWPRL